MFLSYLLAYKEQKVRKDQSDSKTKKDTESTTTMNVDNDDDIEEIPEEIPDDDSVADAEPASWMWYSLWCTV